MCDAESYYVISDCEGDSIYKSFGCECYHKDKCESCHENKINNIKNNLHTSMCIEYYMHWFYDVTVSI